MKHAPMTLAVALAVALGWQAGAGRSAVADDKDKAAVAVVDKAIAALGGEEALGKASAAKSKSDGKLIIDDNENDFSITSTYQGLDRVRTEFQGSFNGGDIKGTTVVRGDRGWRAFGDNVSDFDEDSVENEKRNLYLAVVPVTLLPLKADKFKLEKVDDAKVDAKTASVLKITGPDKKTFKLFFDQETGYPIRMTATVIGFGGEEYEQTSNYADYKPFGAMKKATRVQSLRDGKPFLEMTVKTFDPLEKVDADTFSEPK